MDSGLEGKVAFITGASGGIGREVARVFADEGARLVLQGRSQFAALEAFVEENGWGDRALCVDFDVSDRAANFDAARRGVERFGRLDVCVANAGIWPTEDLPLHRMDEARLRRTLDVNLFGAIFTVQAFLDQLEKTGPRPDGDGAAIAFTGSTAGRFGEREHCDYSVTKAGMYGLVRTLKNEIVHIDPYARVNMVEPGWTVTAMARPALENDDTITRVVQTLPVQQLGRAVDIANAIAYLCSPHLARHVSGEVITVAGGMEGRVQWTPAEIGVAAVRERIADA